MQRRRAIVAGVLSVGLALGISELLAGLVDGVPSLVTAVGSIFIPFVPPALEDFAIRTFGTSDKFVLHLVTTLGTLAVGGWAGARLFANPPAGRMIWLVFTIIGLLAAIVQPLASVATTVVCLAVASGIGYAALVQLRKGEELLQRLEVASANGVSMPNGSTEAVVRVARRRVLGMLAGVGSAAIVTAAGGRALIRSAPRVDLDAITLPQPQSTVPAPTAANQFAVEGITPIVVPNEDFYRIDTALVVPRIDPETWTLRVFGMVDQEVELSYRDVFDMDMVEAYVTLSCVSNQVGGDLVGNAKWLGVPLGKVLDLAGVQSGADQLLARSFDRWDAGFPTQMAYDRDALLAVGMNGEVLPARSGFPARLVVPGLYGYVSATKWLKELELTTWDAEDGYWIPRGWSKEGPVKTQSRFDVPRRSSTVPVGATVFAGVAWAPHVGIERVEVRADDGDWVEAELSSPLSDDAWVQWKAELDLAAGVHLVEVRATDRTGFTQRPDYVTPRPDGAEGWDVMRVTAA